MSLVLLLYGLCASTFTVSKATLSYTLPIFYTAARMCGGGVVLCLLYASLHRSFPRIRTRDWGLLAQIAFFAVYVASLCDLWPLQYLTSIESSLIFSVTPFMTALFSYLWFGEKMTGRKWMGLGIGMCSILPLVYRITAHRISLSPGHMIVVILHLGSVAASAYGWVVMRELVKERHYSPLAINGLGMLLGGGLALVTSLLVEPWDPVPVVAWKPFTLLLIMIIILSNGLFSNLYSYLLRTYTATLLSFAGFTCPLFASLAGWFFLGEQLQVNFFLSFIAVFLGLYIFYREELRQGYIAQ